MKTRDIFKANLKFYRKKAGLTQEELSERIGYGEGYVSEIESRHIFPKPETIDLIASALNIRISALFDERGSPENIRNAFHSVYAADLEDELKRRISREIESVCRLI